MAKTVPQRRAEANFQHQPEVTCCANCKHYHKRVYLCSPECLKLGMRLCKPDVTAVCDHWKKA